MFLKNINKTRMSPYMKEYLTRYTNTSVNKVIEYYNGDQYLAEKYIECDFEEPKKDPYLGLFLFLVSSFTFYLLSKKTNDN